MTRSDKMVETIVWGYVIGTMIAGVIASVMAYFGVAGE